VYQCVNQLWPGRFCSAEGRMLSTLTKEGYRPPNGTGGEAGAVRGRGAKRRAPPYNVRSYESTVHSCMHCGLFELSHPKFSNKGAAIQLTVQYQQGSLRTQRLWVSPQYLHVPDRPSVRTVCSLRSNQAKDKRKRRRLDLQTPSQDRIM
jgi:hypothetical protein